MKIFLTPLVNISLLYHWFIQKDLLSVTFCVKALFLHQGYSSEQKQAPFLKELIT